MKMFISRIVGVSSIKKACKGTRNLHGPANDFLGRISVLAKETPNVTAVQCLRRGPFTYKQLYHDAKELSKTITATLQEARRLNNGIGIIGQNACRDDLQHPRIAFLQPNNYEWVVTLLAIWHAKGVAIPLCQKHPVSEMTYVLDDAQVGLTISHDYYSNVTSTLIKTPCNYASSIIIQSYDPITTNASLHYQDEDQKRNIDGDAPSMIIYTSGTTGKPKGAVYTHDTVAAQLQMLAKAWAFQPTDHLLHVLPLHHVHGIINALLCPLYAGGKVSFLQYFSSTDSGKHQLTVFDPELVWKTIMTNDDLNVFTAVPTIYSKLLACSSDFQRKIKDRCERAPFRLMMSGSSALPPNLFQAWKDLTGYTLLERYGMTEIGMALSNPYDANQGQRKVGTVGMPLPGVSIKIVATEENPESTLYKSISGRKGQTTPPEECLGRMGELRIKSPAMFKAYHGRPDVTKQSFDSDGWFRTGDVVSIDADGYIIIQGRSREIIKTGGFKVSALEVERCLGLHPCIADVAVIPLEDDVYGDIVVAVVVLNETTILEMAEFRQWCKERLAVYKIPRKVHIVDALPRNVMNKVDKMALQKTFQR